MKTLTVLTFLVLAGCSTVVPKTIDANVASFDGNEQNSGILRSTPAGYVITPHFRDRYNALIDVYGDDFLVHLKRDEGITPLSPTELLIDRQHLDKFLEMLAWQRSGLAPQHTRL
jgi:hypothetical protein